MRTLIAVLIAVLMSLVTVPALADDELENNLSCFDAEVSCRLACSEKNDVDACIDACIADYEACLEKGVQ